VLCAPLGYEGPFAHLALRELAHTLAVNGAAVLRFDYPGYGDSAGDDEAPGQVGLWVGSVRDAIDAVKRLAPSNGPVVVLGLRAGALLAAAAASTREDVTALALWAPSLSGKFFVREQRAFSKLAHVSAASRATREGEWGAKGFEANGYVFTDDTVAELSKLDTKTMPLPGVTHILLLDREEAPVGDALPGAWREGAHVRVQSLQGYAEFMEPPWISVYPDVAIQTIAEWVEMLAPRSTAAIPEATAADVPVSAVVEPGIRETAVWLDGEARQHFGILTEPVDGSARHAIVMITSTFGYRIGPNRMHVVAARHFAAMGVATLRFDLSHTGDSRADVFARANAPYDMSAIADVRRAYRLLAARGYASLALGGVCAGAFMAWRTGMRDREISQMLLVNPEAFMPIEYALRDHQRMLQVRPPFREMLRTERNPLRIAGIFASRALTLGRIIREYTVARVPVVFRPSSLTADIGRVGARGARLSIIFSSDDNGVEEFHRVLGPSLKRHTRGGHLSLAYIEGADHSFTPRWATRTLVKHMAQALAPWVHGSKGSNERAHD
jgi:alpha/beta superfamily hydrolase